MTKSNVKKNNVDSIEKEVKKGKIGEKAIKVVVADQDVQNLDQLRGILEEKGFLIWTTMSGKETIDTIKEVQPDIVLLETMLVNEDGIWVLENLPINFDPKRILVLSKYNSQVLTKKVMRFDIAYFLLKPLSIETLLNRMTDVLTYEDTNEQQFFVGESVVVPTITTKTQPSLWPKEVDGDGIERVVLDVLQEFGIRTQLNGFEFLRVAIRDTFYDPTLHKSMTTRLYPSVAQQCGSTPSRVERAMRHAIETGWTDAAESTKRKFFGVQNAGLKTNNKPTNAGFISAIVTKLQTEYKMAEGI